MPTAAQITAAPSRAVAVVCALLTSLAWSLAPASAAGSSAGSVPNASFESWDATHHAPACWAGTTIGRNTGGISRTTAAKSGRHAGRVQVLRRITGGRLLATRRTNACMIRTTQGALSLWQHSTRGVRILLSYRSASGWSAWKAIAHRAASSAWRRTTVTLPAPPHGARGVAVGVEVTAGTATVDAVTLVPVAPITPALPTQWVAPVPMADGLVTNEFAFWNPSLASSVVSPDWEMTSGSLFARNGSFWTGVPDNANPDATSSNGTDSAVFRLTTKRNDFGDVAVSFTLHNDALSSTTTTPKVDWDGVHIFLRYQTEESLYYASVNRRDGHVVIKKKCAGGPSNGGTYYELGPGEISGHPIPFGVDQFVGASVVNNADGSVTLTLSLGGTTIVTATDTGVGCAPIRTAGKVGIRGDNDDFTFSGFTVRNV